MDRVETGNVLAQLGDPRFRRDAWYLPDDPLFGFVKVDEGEFSMGSSKEMDRNAYKEELPQHQLFLPEFYISRYPVTVAQYRTFVENTSYKTTDMRALKGIENHPVVYVTWYDSLEYCRWLTKILKESDLTPPQLAQLLQKENWQIMLPSEAQWEKAARGDDGRIFPWGDEPDPNCANYNETGINTTGPVGCFPAGKSPFDILDMSGNVWEWTRSLWGKDWSKPDFNYPYDSEDGRENLNTGSDVARVLRGGSFSSESWSVRCAYRYGNYPDYWSRGGFRVVLSPVF